MQYSLASLQTQASLSELFVNASLYSR